MLRLSELFDLCCCKAAVHDDRHADGDAVTRGEQEKMGGKETDRESSQKARGGLKNQYGSQ